MNTKSLTIINGIVIFDGQPIDLPHYADEALEYQNLIIIKIEPPSGIIYNRNVFGVSKDGKISWQIEESPHSTLSDKPYINIFVQGDDLIAANWNGVSYCVNPSNGKITVSSFDK